MNNFTSQPIIVPWDFSEMSQQALRQALELTGSPDRIEVVHVTPYPSAVEPGVIWGNFTEDDISQNLHKSFKKDVAQMGLADLKFTPLFGDPGGEIVKFAKQKKAGLIVISSHGRTGLKRLLMGSVAERVVRLAPCPVLVLRGDKKIKFNSEKAELSTAK